jgi:pimeloyl-ACP methyl ester carboxylesterase
VGLLGRSFGGYWATKLAHLVPERIAGAVNWGGGAHHMFQPEWVQASRHPDSYLMELVETRRLMLGAADDAEYVAFFQRLSLLDQALLDQPCAPLLLVNSARSPTSTCFSSMARRSLCACSPAATWGSRRRRCPPSWSGWRSR